MTISAAWHRQEPTWPNMLASSLPAQHAPDKPDGSPGAEALFARPGWGAETVAFNARGGTLYARRRTAYDKRMAAEKAKGLYQTPHQAAQLNALEWQSAYLSSPTPDFGPGKVMDVAMAIGPHGWGGAWTYAAAPNRATAAEIDNEMTVERDGRIKLRPVMHGNVGGKWITLGEAIMLPRRLVTVRTDWSDPAGIVFVVNGTIASRIDVPEVLRVPMWRIASLQVGGLAPPSKPTDGNTFLSISDWNVTG